MTIELHIRELNGDDDIAAITDLIHSAYARRAADGLRYWATFQTIADTESRFREGNGIIAETSARILGTITVRPPWPESEIPLYRERATWSLSQFAVLPEFQGQGVGRRLHDAAVEFALARGCRAMALDTAAPATDLIEMYTRWGYVQIGEWDWRPHTNYLSIVMARRLAPKSDRPPLAFRT